MWWWRRRRRPSMRPRGMGKGAVVAACVAAGGGGLLLLLLLLPLAVAATEGLDGLDHAAPADDAPGAMPPPGMWFPWSSRERK